MPFNPSEDCPGQVCLNGVNLTDLTAFVDCPKFDANFIQQLNSIILKLNNDSTKLAESLCCVANSIPEFEGYERVIATLFTRTEVDTPGLYADNTVVTLTLSSFGVTAAQLDGKTEAILQVRTTTAQHMDCALGSTNSQPNVRNKSIFNGGGFYYASQSGTDLGCRVSEGQGQDRGMAYLPITNGQISFTYTLQVNMGYLGDIPTPWTGNDYTASSIGVYLRGLV